MRWDGHPCPSTRESRARSNGRVPFHKVHSQGHREHGLPSAIPVDDDGDDYGERLETLSSSSVVVAVVVHRSPPHRLRSGAPGVCPYSAEY